MDRFDILWESLEIKKPDLMAAGRTIECNGTAAVARTQYSNVHSVILLKS
jgi:hypothetical protein